MAGYLPTVLFAAFGSIGMLGWAAAATIPVLIHFWSRRKFAEVPWAAMQFLIGAVQQDARRLQVEQWLLLAVRVSVLLLLALALADPTLSLSGKNPLVTAPAKIHRILVIDGSYSMDARHEGQNAFDRARQLATQLVDRSRQGDGFSIVLMAQPSYPIIGAPAFDKTAVKSEIESLTLPHGGGDLDSACEHVRRIAEPTVPNSNALENTEVYFISDLGTASWNAATSSAATLLQQLAQKATLHIVDVGQPMTENQAITGLRQSEGVATVSREISIVADVRRFVGANARQQLSFFVDGRLVEQRDIEFSDHAEATATFRYRFDSPGAHSVEARLLSDDLQIDNHRFLSVPIRERLRVLCVAGKTDAARDVAIALAPQELQADIETQMVSNTQFSNSELSDFDAVVFCNVARFRDEHAVRLARFLKRSGGVVFFLGDQADADNYNQVLHDTENNAVLPARIGGLVSDGQHRFAPRAYRHPIVAPFAGHEQAGLLTTPIWRYQRLQVPENSQSRVALWYDNGDVAIVESPVGRGRTILVSTAASAQSVDRSTEPPTPWTALSSWPSFPPLVHEMVGRAVSHGTESFNRLVGQSLSATVPLSASTRLSLQHSGIRERLTMDVVDGEYEWLLNDTSTSGIYRVEYEADQIPDAIFATNVSVTESGGGRIDPALLPPYLSHTTSLAATTASLPSSTGRSYARWLLAGVLGLLMLETFLAWFWGYAMP